MAVVLLLVGLIAALDAPVRQQVVLVLQVAPGWKKKDLPIRLAEAVLAIAKVDVTIIVLEVVLIVAWGHVKELVPVILEM